MCSSISKADWTRSEKNLGKIWHFLEFLARCVLGCFHTYTFSKKILLNFFLIFFFDWVAHTVDRKKSNSRSIGANSLLLSRFASLCRALCRFYLGSVFPKFWCGFSVPNIPTVRDFVHFCAVFRSFCRIFVRFLPTFWAAFRFLGPLWHPLIKDV